MEANYGYTDATGDYFITIDSSVCDGCRHCLEACPQSAFEMIEDDYENLVAAVKKAVQKKLKEICAACKPAGRQAELSCTKCCAPNAISHSW